MRRFPRNPWDKELAGEDFELLSEPAPSAISSGQVLEQLLTYLRETFPPRCMETHETLEQHLRYAGKVDLAQWLLKTYGG